jgi:hypothetical protein
MKLFDLLSSSRTVDGLGCKCFSHKLKEPSE